MRFFPKVAPHACDLGEIIMKVGSLFQDHIVTWRSGRIGRHPLWGPLFSSGISLAILIPSFGLICIPTTELCWKKSSQSLHWLCYSKHNTEHKNSTERKHGAVFQAWKLLVLKRLFFFLDWNVNSFIWTISQMETKS